jgi:ABC-type Mn2+/Zn2+ transport system ATPase subunit
VVALDGLNLEVPEGAIYGLVGPNGAGKTTTIKIVMNIIRATSGSAFHLFRYLDEQSFGYNERKHEHGDAGRFRSVVRNIAGKRLKYRKLTGKIQA